MVQYYPGDAKSILQTESSTDEEDVRTPDPGAEVVEKNRRDRMQRMAASTKEELDKVLKRVDHVGENHGPCLTPQSDTFVFSDRR